MNEKQKELIESIGLKTVETMISDKNINLATFMAECYKKDLFFPEFYEITYLKMLTQYPFDKSVDIACAYKNFGLDSYRASQLFNDSTRYINHNLFQSLFSYQNAPGLMAYLNENELYLNEANMAKLNVSLNSIEKERKEEIIQRNAKVKAYHQLEKNLEIKSDTVKIKL